MPVKEGILAILDRLAIHPGFDAERYRRTFDSSGALDLAVIAAERAVAQFADIDGHVNWRCGSEKIEQNVVVCPIFRRCG
jgi:hypothetical protein